LLCEGSTYQITTDPKYTYLKIERVSSLEHYETFIESSQDFLGKVI